MITAAAILLPAHSDCSPLTLLGGLSLLQRAIFTAQRAGATTCYLVTERQNEKFGEELGEGREEELDALRHSLDGDARVTSKLVWVTHAEDVDIPETTEGHCLAFQVQTLFPADLARRLADAATSTHVQAVAGQDDGYALVILPAQGLSRQLTQLVSGDLCATSLARAGWQTAPTLVSAADAFVCHLSSRQDVAEAEKALLLSLPNPKDGLVDAYLNRKLSRPLTRLILPTPLTPNQVTVISCSIGLIGAACFWGGGYVWPIVGGLLLQFSAVVDCMDGEIARVKFLESPLGAWLDITLDTVVHIAIFLGVGMAVWNQGGTTYAPLLGAALAAGAFVSFPFVTMAEKTEEQGKQQGGWENAAIQKMVEGLASRDYSIIVLLCAVIQQLSWFLWSAAIGVQVFWLSLALLLHKAGRLNWGVFSSRSQDA